MRTPHHKFVVIAPMIMKFGTGIQLDVFYTMLAEIWYLEVFGVLVSNSKSDFTFENF